LKKINGVFSVYEDIAEQYKDEKLERYTLPIKVLFDIFSGKIMVKELSSSTATLAVYIPKFDFKEKYQIERLLYRPKINQSK
jgi:hypothetical protein